MRFHRVMALCVLAPLAIAAIAARKGVAVSPDDTNPLAEDDARILSEVRDHSEAAENLEYISDRIGPRLTGSPQLKQANEWTAEVMRKYGLVNVHLEPWTIAHSWTRGTASARIIAPTEHPLTIASAGWAPGTNGTVRGPVIFFDAKSKDDFAKYKGKLKGAIVIATEPQPLSPPRPEDANAEYVRPMQVPPPPAGQPPAPSPFAALTELGRARNEFFKAEGVAAVLRDSNKPHTLLNMTGVGGEKFDTGPIPNAFITGEGYRMVWRLLKHGSVTVEINMTNSFSDKMVEVYNTVGEIRGSEKPDEVIVLGAHLDSWDLGTGSTDNGTGSAAVLEAARALAKSGLKPKRTIRFILFSGEEEGLVGSAKYVEAHKADLDKISAVLVHDTGTGRVLTLGLHDNYQAREIVDQVLAPLGELKLLEPSMVRAFGTDHASFDDVGVPGFFCIQNGAEYAKTHHSQSDTFDKVWKDDLNQGAQVLAAWAYNTAQLPDMLPRRPVAPKPEPAPLPNAYHSRESATLLWRLLDAGPVEAEVNIQGTLTGKPVTVYNTVAELKGTEKPDEVVIIGGHLDSWDLATGATDNGTGSMAVLAAARALVKSGVRPKRTIRFVLFTGEEQGLNGSRAYVAAHKEEMGKISGILVHDTGTGKVLTIGLMHNYGLRETMARVLYPLATDKSIGLAEPSLRSEGGSDHVPFDAEGVPASWCIQEVANYEKDHHSQNDTLDRVRWDDLAEGAQVLAVYAYNVAQLPEMLPRKPVKPAQPEAHSR